jgi:hypothetical protein
MQQKGVERVFVRFYCRLSYVGGLLTGLPTTAAGGCGRQLPALPYAIATPMREAR